MGAPIEAENGAGHAGTPLQFLEGRRLPADVFPTCKVAGHGSVTISERYVDPTLEGQERAFERSPTGPGGG